MMVDYLHAELLQQDGGSYGVRDDGLIESALARPRNRWEYQDDCTLEDLAAAYAFGLARNHGFIDGNKRVALAAMTVFLRLNGWALHADEAETTVVMLELAAGERGEAELSAWISEHIAEVQKRRKGGAMLLTSPRAPYRTGDAP